MTPRLKRYYPEATFDGKKAGSFGLTGCFSFYPAKVLGAAGDAGIMVTDDKEMEEKVRLFRDHGRATKKDIAFYGYNSRLDNLQAAILNVKFRYMPRWIERRRELAGLYQEGLKDIPYIKLPPPPETQGRYFDTYQNYILRAQERERLVEHLGKCDIEILISFAKPIHFQETLGLTHFRLPMTEQLAKEVVSLPMYPELGNEQVAYVVESIRNFYMG